MKKYLLNIFAIMGMFVSASAQSDVDAVIYSCSLFDDLDRSYLISDSVVVTFPSDDDVRTKIVNQNLIIDLPFSTNGTIRVDFGKSHLITANQDPESNKYVSTFYSSKSVYRLPEDGFKSYICENENEIELLTGENEVALLRLVGNDDEYIPAGEGVIIRKDVTDPTQKSIQFRLMPSSKTLLPNINNILSGTDTLVTSAESKTYALSYGQKGVAFYDFTGKSIPANRSFLYLSPESMIKSFTFVFDDDDSAATDINTATINETSADAYNLQGLRVNGNYSGIIIKNGKKYLKK